MANAKRDANRVPTIVGVSSVDLVTPTLIRVNPTTGAMIGEVSSVDYSTTSTTSLAIATGSKVFTVADSDRPYLVGTRLRASSNADPADYMEGLVTSYSGTTLTILVDNIGGTGTDADWNINLAGDVGDTGATGATGSTGATGPAGAGKRTATLIVAASDSLSQTAGDYDYLCDGVDDHLTIETAIAALPAGGGKIILLEGSYVIGASVDIAKSNVILEGQGASTILSLANTSNVDVVTLGAGATTYSHITVKNIKINGNMANQTTAGYGIFISAGLTHAKVENCWIINTLKSSIGDNGSSTAEIVNNYCDTTKVGEGYTNIYGFASKAKIINNVCISGDGGGIYLWSGATDQLVSQNLIVTPTTVGIEVDGTDAVVSNNIIDTPTTIGIDMEGDRYIVSGNYVINAGTRGINLVTNQGLVVGNYLYATNDPTIALIDIQGTRCNVQGNYFFVTTGNTAAVTAVLVNDTDANVNGNFIYFTTSQAHKGINSQGNTNVIIVNNQVVSNANTDGSIGIQFTGDEGTVSGNRINGFALAMDLTGMDYGTATNNKISNSTSGILITNASQSVINGNSLDTITDYGIKALNTVAKAGLSIVGNTLASVLGDGIHLQGVTYSSISNNVFRITAAGDTTILITSTGTAYSIYNTISGNAISSTGTITNGIKENSANDGPNIILGNIVKNCTNPIVTAHVSTDVSHNITA